MHVPASRLAHVLLWISLLSSLPVQAGNVAQVAVEPATVRQGDQAKTVVQTKVTLASPAATYFICELRSAKRREVVCNSIIFKKGDVTGVGTATIYWDKVNDDENVKISAFSVDDPDAASSFTITLRKKHGDNPDVVPP